MAIRSSNIVSTSSGSTTVSLPTGTIVGDFVLLFVGAAYFVDPPTPVGWTSFASGGPPITWNGNSFFKVMVASDITTGTVTVPFEGGFQNVVGMVTLVGNPGLHVSGVGRFVPEGTPDILSTTLPASAGDIAIYFSSNRGASTDTVNRGVQIQTTTQTNGSGAIYSETLSASGVVTANFTYTPTFSTGAYDVIAVVNGTVVTKQLSLPSSFGNEGSGQRGM